MLRSKYPEFYKKKNFKLERNEKSNKFDDIFK